MPIYRDNELSIVSGQDFSKVLRFKVDAVTAPETRYLRMADHDVDLSQMMTSLPAHAHASGDGGNIPASNITGLPVYAPTNAKYIVQEASGDLSAEQSLGTLGTGLLKNTATANVGVLSVVNAPQIVASLNLTLTGGTGAVTLLTGGSNAPVGLYRATFTSLTTTPDSSPGTMQVVIRNYRGGVLRTTYMASAQSVWDCFNGEVPTPYDFMLMPINVNHSATVLVYHEDASKDLKYAITHSSSAVTNLRLTLEYLPV